MEEESAHELDDLVFELFLNEHLSSHGCKAQQISIDEFFHFGLESMTNFCRVPHLSSRVSTSGMRVRLTTVGKLSRLDLFRHNCPNLNQYR